MRLVWHRIQGLPNRPECAETDSPLAREFNMPDKPKKEAPHNGNGQKSIEVTPMKLLAIILKVVLKDRITDEEVETICSNYYKTINDWWG